MLGYPTIHSSGCEILICIGPLKRCLQCTMHRKSLYAMISQNRAETSTERVMPTSHTNYRYMSAPSLDSLERIFWEQQEKAALVKNARSMKWHPLMIRWCLYLRHISGKAYEAMRRSGILKLPTQRTLKDYTYYTSTTIGFSVHVALTCLASQLMGLHQTVAFLKSMKNSHIWIPKLLILMLQNVAFSSFLTHHI